MSAEVRVGWRLTVEPMGEHVGWSMFRRERPFDGPAGPTILVGGGVIEGAGRLRPVVLAAVPADVGSSRHADGVEGEGRGARVEDPWACGLAVPAQERDAARDLGRVLIPEPLRHELLSTDDKQHLVTVAARGWLSAVPWDALALDEAADVRLVERAQVVGGLSPALLAARPERRREPRRRSIAVVDPGPVGLGGELDPLYPLGYPAELEERESDGRLSRLMPGWDPMTSEDFGVVLREPDGWSSLCFVGHVRRGEGAVAGAAGLVFQRDGRAELLTARRWIADPDRWPAPPRVALIGCGSDDGAFVEQTGLPVAALRAGAEFVVSTRWPLSADRTPGRAMGTTALVAVVIDAFAEPWPEVALRRWQLAQLARWRADGEPETSPLLWASLVCYAPPAFRTPSPGSQP